MQTNLKEGKLMKRILIFIVIIFFSAFFCTSSRSQQYIILGWNDLGMHCANKDFSKIAVLPPYNNVESQIIKKQTGQLPQIVVGGYKIQYNIPGNTYSVEKTNFWTYAQELFGLPQPLPNNIGLTGHGLTGNMDTSGNGFIITGVPVTPFQDNNLVQEQPFQLIHLDARLISNPGTTLAFTDAVIPVSNEIGCVQSGCHSSEQAIKNEHENVPGFHTNSPELCARCHASNALGTIGDSLAKPLSYRIHDTHHDIQPINGIETCYKCHPGPNTQCLRDTMRANGMVCQNCHGTMQNLANSILNGRRPWLDEPKCGSITCHGSVYAEEPNKLYRMSRGHGGLFCSACHGSPHAIFPSREANDNLQNIRLQGHAGVLKDCMVCHSTPPTGPGPHGIYYIGIKPISSSVPLNYKLYQNYPNPFNPQTTITFELHEASVVTISIFDNLGRLIEAPSYQLRLNAGKYEYKWNAKNLTSGTYFCRLSTEKYSNTVKMILIK
jgi:hypothetical protein